MSAYLWNVGKLLNLGPNCCLFVEYVQYGDKWRVQFTKDYGKRRNDNIDIHDEQLKRLQKLRLASKEELEKVVNTFLDRIETI